MHPPHPPPSGSAPASEDVSLLRCRCTSDVALSKRIDFLDFPLYQERCISRGGLATLRALGFTLFTGPFQLILFLPPSLPMSYSFPLSLSFHFPSPPCQGRSQKFVSEGDKTGGLGTEVPQRIQGQSPGGGLGAKPPEAEDIYANNHRDNVLPVTKKTLTKFSVWEFPEGHVPFVPPSIRPCPLLLHSPLPPSP